MKKENWIIAQTEVWAIVRNERYSSIEICHKPHLRKGRTGVIDGKSVEFPPESPLKLNDSGFGWYSFAYLDLGQVRRLFFGKNRGRYEDMSSEEQIREIESAFDKFVAEVGIHHLDQKKS